MSETLSDKYQKNKKRLQKKLVKDIKIFLNRKKKKSNNMAMNVTRISQKMIKQKLVEHRKKYYRMRKNV